MVSSARAGAPAKTPRPSAMLPAPCSKWRRDNPLTRSDIHCSFVRTGDGDVVARPLPYRRSRSLPLYLSYYTEAFWAAICAQSAQQHRSFMSDLVRLEYRNVTMRFAATGNRGVLTAVQNVNLRVRDGEVVSLIGPSGCGKSTLLNIGSGLTAPSEGDAFVDGERVTGPNAHVAFMLQKDLLLPWRTIAENVMFGVEIQGVPQPECERRAKSLLESFSLGEFSGHYPHQLSGGMRQRVALARTLAVDPHVLLLDEPFSAVDAQTRMVLQRDLAKTLREAQKTALLITHDLLEAVTLSDRVLVMSRRPGAIVDEIKIDVPRRDDPIARRGDPKVNAYVARLMDRLDIAHASLEQQPAGGAA